jgi:hypothetical protein
MKLSDCSELERNALMTLEARRGRVH